MAEEPLYGIITGEGYSNPVDSNGNPINSGTPVTFPEPIIMTGDGANWEGSYEKDGITYKAYAQVGEWSAELFVEVYKQEWGSEGNDWTDTNEQYLSARLAPAPGSEDQGRQPSRYSRWVTTDVYIDGEDTREHFALSVQWTNELPSSGSSSGSGGSGSGSGGSGSGGGGSGSGGSGSGGGGSGSGSGGSGSGSGGSGSGSGGSGSGSGSGGSSSGSGGGESSESSNDQSPGLGSSSGGSGSGSGSGESSESSNDQSPGLGSSSGGSGGESSESSNDQSPGLGSSSGSGGSGSGESSGGPESSGGGEDPDGEEGIFYPIAEVIVEDGKFYVRQIHTGGTPVITTGIYAVEQEQES